MKNKNFENRTAIFPQLKNKDGKLSRDERKTLRSFAEFIADLIIKDMENRNINDGNLEDDK